jgi:hypothetical protein
MKTATVARIAAFALLGTTVLAQHVTTDYDRSANFASFKTYAWIRGSEVPDQLNHKRIVQSIDAQLMQKGMRMVEKSANPDVLVAYHVSFDRDLQINGFSSGWGAYRWGGNRTGTARAEEITVGTLVVDMIDAHSKTIVWRGTASKDVDEGANAARRDKNARKAMEKLFKNYPPKPFDVAQGKP